MVRFLFAPTVRSSPTGRLIATYFNLESTRAMLSKKGGWFIVVGLYNHQLLVWPTLVQETLPQLWVEACPDAVVGVTTETLPTTSAAGWLNWCKLMPSTASNSFPTVSSVLTLPWECWQHLDQQIGARVHKLHQSHRRRLGGSEVMRKPAAPGSMKLDPKCWLLSFQKKRLAGKEANQRTNNKQSWKKEIKTKKGMFTR